MTTDVLIVGAGPTGLTLAVGLATPPVHCDITPAEAVWLVRNSPSDTSVNHTRSEQDIHTARSCG